MTGCSEKLKRVIMKRILGTDPVPVSRLAREEGASDVTLNNWRKGASKESWFQGAVKAQTSGQQEKNLPASLKQRARQRLKSTMLLSSVAVGCFPQSVFHVLNDWIVNEELFDGQCKA